MTESSVDQLRRIRQLILQTERIQSRLRRIEGIADEAGLAGLDSRLAWSAVVFLAEEDRRRHESGLHQARTLLDLACFVLPRKITDECIGDTVEILEKATKDLDARQE